MSETPEEAFEDLEDPLEDPPDVEEILSDAEAHASDLGGNL